MKEGGAERRGQRRKMKREKRGDKREAERERKETGRRCGFLSRSSEVSRKTVRQERRLKASKRHRLRQKNTPEKKNKRWRDTAPSIKTSNDAGQHVSE